MAKDYYKILGISKKADEKEIKSAYRKLARKYHPDVNPNDAAAEAKFKEITEAYDVLKDPEKKKMYDKFGDNWESASKVGDHFGGGSAGGFNVGGFNMGGAGGGGFESVFEQIFQNFGGGGGRGHMFQQIPPQDVEQAMSFTLEEIDQGTRRGLTYQVQDACSQCQGAGHVQTNNQQLVQCPTCKGRGTIPNTRKVDVKIPAGVPDGKKLRVPGGGAKGSGGKAGDLFVIVRTLPHSRFKRDKDSLETEVEIDYLTAILGGEISVPTLRTSGSIQVPAGTQTGRRFRLKERGLARMNSGRGDLLVRVKVTLPEELSKEEMKLIEKLRDLRDKNEK